MANPQKSKNWAIIVEKYDTNFENEVTEDFLLKKLPVISSKFYFILHDKDTNDDNTLKREHYHIILVCEYCVSKNSILSILQTCLQIDKNRISVIRCYNLKLDIQYLCHLNESDKFHYDMDLIKTNDIVGLDNALKNKIVDSNIYTFEELYKIVSECNSLTDIIRKVGIDYYKTYRYVITDMFKEIKIASGDGFVRPQ